MYNMGEPRIKIIAMPKDTNPNGNIFGGWIMSQIDLAGSLAATDITHGCMVTVAVNSLVFKEPVHVGDVVSCYSKIAKIGNTSITAQVEVIAERMADEGNACVHVTSACITYVQVDKDGNKKAINPDKSVLQSLGL